MKLHGIGPMAGMAYVNPNMEMYKLKLEQERAAMEEKRQAYAITKDLSEMFDVGKVENAYDHQKQSEFASERLKYLGEYIQKNPDFMYDPSKYMYVRGMSRELKDNKWTRRSDTYKEQAKAFNDAVRANPELMNTPSYQRMAIQLKNRADFGSIDGDDSENEFIYQPTFTWDKDWAKTLGTHAKNIPTVFKEDRRRGYGGGWLVADEGQIANLTESIFSGSQKEQWLGMWGTEQEAKMMIAQTLRSQVEGMKPVQGTYMYEEAALKAQLLDKEYGLKAAAEGTQFRNYWDGMMRPVMERGQAMNLPFDLAKELVGETGNYAVFANGSDGRATNNIQFDKIVSHSQSTEPSYDIKGNPVHKIDVTGQISLERAHELGITNALDSDAKITKAYEGKALVVDLNAGTGEAPKYVVHVKGERQFMQDDKAIANSWNNYWNKQSNNGKAYYDPDYSRGGSINQDASTQVNTKTVSFRGRQIPLDTTGKFVVGPGGKKTQLTHTVNGRQVAVHYDFKRQVFVNSFTNEIINIGK